ncbi:hypothetical protein EDB86DRAFT_2830612 [Lactarius hatsudake]|nr:hypothetical protein EDB86DRAFT_2830612 [Lactarius hatsudake]
MTSGAVDDAELLRRRTGCAKSHGFMRITHGTTSTASPIIPGYPPSDRGRYTSAWKKEPGIVREGVTNRVLYSLIGPTKSRSCTTVGEIEQAVPNRRRPQISHSFYGILFAEGFIQQTVFSHRTRPLLSFSNPGGSVQRKVVNMEFAGVTKRASCDATGSSERRRSNMNSQDAAGFSEGFRAVAGTRKPVIVSHIPEDKRPEDRYRSWQQHKPRSEALIQPNTAVKGTWTRKNRTYKSELRERSKLGLYLVHLLATETIKFCSAAYRAHDIHVFEFLVQYVAIFRQGRRFVSHPDKKEMEKVEHDLNLKIEAHHTVNPS